MLLTKFCSIINLLHVLLLSDGLYFHAVGKRGDTFRYIPVANLQAIGNQVPGADMSYVRETDGKNCWNLKPDVWTINVWWDSDQQ